MNSDSEVEPTAASARSASTMREARERAGMTLVDVAARTRVPLRHLEALETGNLEALPGPTYVTGFGRAYARAVGLDEAALVSRLRSEMAETGQLTPDPYRMEEPVAPARLPSRILAWTAAIIALLFAGGYGIWRMQINEPPTADDLATVPVATTAGPQPAPVVRPPVLTGPVVLTAADGVWLRIYDADGKVLLEKAMAKGESYTVPPDARDPMILTGRPDALAVTVGGRAIPPLGTAERTISDVLLTPAALLGRAQNGGGTGQAGTAAPTQSAPAAMQQPTPPASMSSRSTVERRPRREGPAASRRQGEADTTPSAAPATPAVVDRAPPAPPEAQNAAR